MTTSTIIGRRIAASAAAFVIAAMLPLAASAGPGSGSAHGRAANQQKRLDQGLQSGQLTHKEYNRDEARLQSIDAQRSAEKQANGGHLTSAERQKLQNEYARSGRDIYFTKHNSVNQSWATDRGKRNLPNLPSRNSPGYIGDRVQRQMDRIHNGVVTGSITQHEYRVDQARLAKIDTQRDRWLKAQNGTLTEAQKAQLNAELDRESKQIQYTRHNSTDQPGR